MTVDVFPDVEGALVTFLKANAGVSAIVAARVFFGLPKGATEATYPLIVVMRVGGGDDASEVPIDNALVQIDVWGAISTKGYGLKAGCTTLANAVRSACRSVVGSTTIAPGVDAAGIQVQSAIWMPDPANDRPRYVLTAEVSAISS